MLQERNQGCRDGRDLVGCDVNEGHIALAHYGEVCLQTAADALVSDLTVVGYVHIGLCHQFALLFLCAEVYATVLAQVHLAVFYLAVGGLDEAQVVDACINAKG